MARRERFFGSLQNIEVEGKRHSCRRIKNAPALDLQAKLSITNLMSYIQLIELTTLSAKENLGHTQRFHKASTDTLKASALPSVLSGTSERWKLWQVEFYGERFVLNYYDMSGAPSPTALRISLSYPETEFSFAVRKPNNFSEKAPYYVGINYCVNNLHKAVDKILVITFHYVDHVEAVEQLIKAFREPD